MVDSLSAIIQAFGPFGLLPLGLLGVCCDFSWLGAVVLPSAPRRQQLLCGVVLVLSALVGGMQVLLYLGAVRRGVVLSGLVLLTLAAYLAQRRRGRHARTEIAQRFWDASTLPLLALTAFGLSIACLTAYWLPIWHWDSLGYHLPFVNFVLQGGGFAELPRDVPYLSTYPRNVELLFAVLRVMLPDDRLLDLGQLPFGVAGAAATVGVARELGAGRPEAVVAGAAWLLIPAVFLQLPSNYIDVASATFFILAAFFVLQPATPISMLCAGLATGLFLGSKPSAPPAAALLCSLIVVRGMKAKHVRSTVLAVVACGALGLEAYATELVRHGNPVWPAIVDIGPLHFNGTTSVQELLSSGAGTEKVFGSLPVRIYNSWSNFRSSPAFDMRVGGLGGLFWLAFPGAILLLGRASSQRLPYAALLSIVLVTPDPAVVRYILAFPALVLAGAAATLSVVPKTWRVLARLLVALTGAHSLKYSVPGLTGEGPALLDYATLSWTERAVAVGANGRPTNFVTLRNRLAPGEIAIYDRSLWLQYLMWRSDSSNRVIRIPDGASIGATKSLLEQPRVRVIVAGTDQAAAAAIAQEPDRFTFSFACPESCRAYFRP